MLYLILTSRRAHFEPWSFSSTGVQFLNKLLPTHRPKTCTSWKADLQHPSLSQPSHQLTPPTSQQHFLSPNYAALTAPSHLWVQILLHFQYLVTAQVLLVFPRSETSLSSTPTRHSLHSNIDTSSIPLLFSTNRRNQKELIFLGP